ncbi:hypothetical protein AMJ39_06575 [candidate division TA06 bacterium DG_24]|uniref:Archease domain-containing protein n=3 Tax=Bacteria division TA06 TaxID=1156500 RepID=A0A0S8JM79_UNCT6|nr:MAG: hypothetical protein AMJ39_06575 [candidate division TA06 bacterium DG_24]KPK68608.1 MAG: hypothetical protein AMJ82_07790 [candidate division TA06 bacterium SM23_40]KPL10849.1 MAG: hypothetical protein AMJ71_01685 [candidate division TA06 bacterium SM1_40]
MGSYEVLEHTADLSLTIHGTTLEDLFATAARAMFECLVDIGSISASVEMDIHVVNGDEGVEELLVEWLRELLYRLATDEMLFCRFDIGRLSDREVVARCAGELVDPERHRLRTEIKSVTYHDLEVRQEPRGWVAHVLFDI